MKNTINMFLATWLFGLTKSFILLSVFSLIIDIWLFQISALLESEFINEVSSRLIFVAIEYPIRECPRYYAKQTRLNLHSICDIWSEELYKTLDKNQTLPKGATIELFRNSILWREVQKHAKQ